ncbi:MAG: hypothetical protein HY717_06960 [Planctomycetes bacterium]|nr:hypothetical protein [Planctomycetota bacterium]
MLKARSLIPAVISIFTTVTFAQETDLDFAIPSTPGLQVFPGAAPPRVESFFRKRGPDWIVHWDFELETPRLLVAKQNLPLLPEGAAAGPESLADAARRFVSENREFFGLAGEDLIGPSSSRLDAAWHLAFSQRGPDGSLVRGAGLRFLFDAGGGLLMATGFILRDPPALAGGLPAEAEVLLRAEEYHGLKVLGLTRQLIFPAPERRAARLAWCLHAERPDTKVVELFLGENGELIGERPLAMGFGGCNQNSKLPFEASGTVTGYCPDPEDIYALASGTPRDDFYPVPGIRVFNTESKEALTDDFGGYLMHMNEDRGVFGVYLVLLECPGKEDTVDVPREILKIRRTDPFNSSCNVNSEIIQFNQIIREVKDPIDFIFNAQKEPEQAFELMVYHHMRSFYQHSKELMDHQDIEFQSRYFPLNVVVQDPNFFRGETGAASYTPKGELSSICIARAKRLATWHPATVIQHEYAHHIIHTVTASAQASDMVEGLADALTALKNGNARIGFISEADPGPLGFSLASKVEEMRPLDPELTIRFARGMTGKIFWSIYNYLNINNKAAIVEAEVLLYRYLAAHRVNQPADKAFEFSKALFYELLKLDDLKGEKPFFGADDSLITGTPHWQAIAAAFEDFLPSTPFIRGDADGSGAVDLSDAVNILTTLFLGGEAPPCLEALDADGTAAIDLSDAIYILTFLFLGGPEPANPYPDCSISLINTFWCKEYRCPAR